MDQAVRLEQRIEELDVELERIDIPNPIRVEAMKRIGVCKELLLGVIAGQASADQLARALSDITTYLESHKNLHD